MIQEKQCATSCMYMRDMYIYAPSHAMIWACHIYPDLKVPKFECTICKPMHLIYVFRLGYNNTLVNRANLLYCYDTCDMWRTGCQYPNNAYISYYDDDRDMRHSRCQYSNNDYLLLFDDDSIIWGIQGANIHFQQSLYIIYYYLMMNLIMYNF